MMSSKQAQMIQNLMAQQNNDGVLSFKAGRLFMDAHTRIVTADEKRGKIKIQRDDMGLMHLHWINRMSNQQELDLMLMPGSMDVLKVDDCKDGRVIVLRDKNSDTRHFFWMQESKEDKDKEYLEKLNKVCEGKSLTDESKEEEKESGGTGTSGTAPAAPATGAVPPGQLTQAQLLRMISGAGGASSGTAPTGTTGAASNPNQQQLLMNAMMNALGGGANGAAPTQPPSGPALTDVLNAEDVMKIFEDEEVMKDLAPLLPEGMRTKESIRTQLEGPALSSTIRRLQSVINSPEMGALITQMGLQAEDGKIGVRAFLEAIQRKADKEKEEEEKKDNK